MGRYTKLTQMLCCSRELALFILRAGATVGCLQMLTGWTVSRELFHYVSLDLFLSHVEQLLLTSNGFLMFVPPLVQTVQLAAQWWGLVQPGL